MVLRLSDLRTSREEFTNPKVGFITSIDNLSITTNTFGTEYEIDKYWNGCMGGDGNIYFGTVYQESEYKVDLGNILKFNPKTEEITKIVNDNLDLGLNGLICGKDGNIYTIPGTASTVYKLDVYNETLSPFSNSNSTSAFDYRSGCLAPNGSIYAMPSSATTILKINPSTQSTSNFGSLSSSGQKWQSAVLGADGFIYGIPYAATTILKINPNNDTISTFGSVSGGWIGGCLAPNGKIYCPPFNSFLTTSVLKIDPVVGTTTTLGPIDLSFFTYYSGSIYHGWRGATLASNGKIYCSPLGGKGILEINPEDDTVSVIGVGSMPPIAEKAYTGFGVDPESYRWASFVMAPDGKMYAPPATEDKILVLGEVSNQEPADWLLSPYCNKGS